MAGGPERKYRSAGRKQIGDFCAQEQAKGGCAGSLATLFPVG